MTDLTGREAIPQIATLINEIDICVFATRGDDGQLHARSHNLLDLLGDRGDLSHADARFAAAAKTFAAEL